MNAVMKDLFVEQEIITEISDKNKVSLFVKKWDIASEKLDKVPISLIEAAEIQKLNKVKFVKITLSTY
jgi:hypothetical protein